MNLHALLSLSRSLIETAARRRTHRRRGVNALRNAAVYRGADAEAAPWPGVCPDAAGVEPLSRTLDTTSASAISANVASRIRRGVKTDQLRVRSHARAPLAADAAAAAHATHMP